MHLTNTTGCLAVNNKTVNTYLKSHIKCYFLTDREEICECAGCWFFFLTQPGIDRPSVPFGQLPFDGVGGLQRSVMGQIVLPV